MSKESLVTTTGPAQTTQPPRQRNRRLSLRRVARSGSKAICRKGSLGLGPNVALLLLDISETGVRLIVTHPLPEGQEVEVSLLAPGHVREVRHLGRVVWAVPAQDGTWCVGIQFEKSLPYSIVQDLGRFS